MPGGLADIIRATGHMSAVIIGVRLHTQVITVILPLIAILTLQEVTLHTTAG